MPFALALLASALLHAAALIGPGWPLPGLDEAEAPPAIEAVLARPAAGSDAAPAAKPAPKSPAGKPRPRPGPAAAPPAASTVPAPSAALAETPPVAVAPVPTLEPAMPAPALSPVAISALPAKGSVRYVITRGENGLVVGQTVHTWEHDGLAYKAQSVAETTGLAALFKPARVVQSSEGQVTGEGLKPHEYRHQRVVGLDSASFDWVRRVVAYGGREESIAPGTQDMLSMYYQVVLLAPRSGALDVPIATGRKLESFRLEVLGEETLALPAGERRAMHLKTRSGNDSIELWLAVGTGAERRGLPLKIRFTDRKGEIFDQIAQDIDIMEKQ